MSDRRVIRMAWTGLVGGMSVGAVVVALTLVPSVQVKAGGSWGGSISGATRIGVASDAKVTADSGFPAELDVAADLSASADLETALEASAGKTGKPYNPGQGPGGDEDEKYLPGGGHPDEDDADDEAVEEPGEGDEEKEQDREQDRDRKREQEQDHERQQERDREREQDDGQHGDQDQGNDQRGDQDQGNGQGREQAELRKQQRLKLGFEAGSPPGQQEGKQQGQVGIVSLADGEVEVSVKLEMNLAAQLHSSLQFALNHGYEYEWAVEVLQQLNLNLAAGADIKLLVEIVEEGIREGSNPDEILARLRVEVGTPPSSPPDTGEPTEPSEAQPTQPGEPTEPSEPAQPPVAS